MTLRFEVIGRISTVAVFAVLACSNNDDNTNTGTAGASSTAGSTSGTAGSTSGTAGNSSGTSGSGGASGSAGMVGTSGSVSTAGAGGTGGSSGGSAGASAGMGGASGSGGASGNKSKTTFFVTSDTSKTGKLGGLTMADARCQALAMKAGFGDHTFHAYLSTATVNAKDRIGTGPWVNSAGVVVAADLAALHSATLKGNPDLFIDENKMKIHGQWDGGTMVEHDILTGSKADGTVQTGVTCQDWTSDAAGDTGQVGHSDGMGPGKATTGTYTSWNSSHASGSCGDTSKSGGAGRLYCFAID